MVALFKLLGEQLKARPNGFIKSVHAITDDFTLALNPFFSLRFMAPLLHDEHDKFISRTFKKDDESKSLLFPRDENNPDANLLSTLIQIQPSDLSYQVFLCSDTTRDTLRRIITKNFEFHDLVKTPVIGIQAPHHGSSKNHFPEFWESFPGLKDAYVVISAGDGYGHPDYDVVNFFYKHTYQVHSTNYTGGYKYFFDGHAKDEPDFIDFPTEVMRMFDQINSIPPPHGARLQCCEKLMVLNKTGDKFTCIIKDPPFEVA